MRMNRTLTMFLCSKNVITACWSYGHRALVVRGKMILCGH